MSISPGPLKGDKSSSHGGQQTKSSGMSYAPLKMSGKSSGTSKSSDTTKPSALKSSVIDETNTAASSSIVGQPAYDSENIDKSDQPLIACMLSNYSFCKLTQEYKSASRVTGNHVGSIGLKSPDGKTQFFYKNLAALKKPQNWHTLYDHLLDSDSVSAQIKASLRRHWNEYLQKSNYERRTTIFPEVHEKMIQGQGMLIISFCSVLCGSLD